MTRLSIQKLRDRTETSAARWKDMAVIWNAQKRCKSKVPNPVIEERNRRRR